MPSEEQMEEQRNKLWGCFFMTKQKIFSENNQLQEIVSAAQENSQKIYKKILAEQFESCVNQIQVEESKQVSALF